MSDPTVAATDVLYRLGIDATDATANQTTQYIAFADGWADKLLAVNGKDAADLETYETALLKQAKINVAAKMALTGMSLDSGDFAVGPIKISGLTAKEKIDLMAALDAEIEKVLNMLGFLESMPYVSSSGGDNYAPDGEDLTNIDFGETADYPFSTFG